MPAKKVARRTYDPIRALTVEQRASLLDKLVRGSKTIRARAQRLAEEILGSVDVDEIADEVAGAIDFVDSEDVYARAGSTRDGYVDPGEEAWECLGEQVEPFLEDLRARVKQGRFEEAARVCQGILLGLYRHRGGHETNEKALSLAEDFPSEAADDALELYFGKRTAKKKNAKPAGPPFPDEFWSRIPSWAEIRPKWEGTR